MYNPVDNTSLIDSITTTNDNSLIVACIVLGSPEVFSQSGSTVIVQESDSERIDNALLSLDAPTAGVYAPSSSYTTANRSAMISAELVEQAAPKATTFIVR